MISKELLSEVLNKNITEVYIRKNEIRIKTKIDNVDGWSMSSDVPLPNIYELANKCKNWAFEKHSLMLFQTQYFPNIFYGIKDLKTSMEDFITKVPQCDRFKSDTEPEAIFKACQWILENK